MHLHVSRNVVCDKTSDPCYNGPHALQALANWHEKKRNRLEAFRDEHNHRNSESRDSGPWARVLVNSAKGYMAEESIDMGWDGTELTSTFKLSEVSDGVWFPKEILMNTAAANEQSRIRSERLQLLDFKLGES